MDILTIESVRSQKYDFKEPTIIPSNWTTYNNICQETYNEIFNKYNPVMHDILKDTDNIVVAGGAALNPLDPRKIYYDNDVDIFIYNTDNIWEKINEVTQKIINRNPQCDITHSIKKGLISLYINRKEYQIIIRNFPDINSIIHSFDLPSCCIAFTGKITYFTPSAAYACATQINMINVKKGSLSFDSRIKKYFTRGFGVALVGYNIDNGLKDGLLLHNYLKISIISIKSPRNYMCGNIDVIHYDSHQIIPWYDTRSKIELIPRTLHDISTDNIIDNQFDYTQLQNITYNTYINHIIKKDIYKQNVEYILNGTICHLINMNNPILFKSILDTVSLNMGSDYTTMYKSIKNTLYKYMEDILLSNVDFIQTEYSCDYIVDTIVNRTPEQWYGPNLYKDY